MQNPQRVNIGSYVPGVIIILACASWTGSLIGRAAAGDRISQAVCLLFVPILTAIMVAQYACTFLRSRSAAISLQFCYVVSIGLIGYATVQAKPMEAAFALVAIVVLGLQIFLSWNLLSNRGGRETQRDAITAKSGGVRAPRAILPHVLGLGGIAVAVGLLALMTYNEDPPISLRHASPAEANAANERFRIPAEAKDICIEHKWLNTRFEFSIDEAGFRKWAAEQFEVHLFNEKSKRVFEIFRPAKLLRYDNSEITVENGLMAEDDSPNRREPQMVYDSKSQRAYFWYASH